MNTEASDGHETRLERHMVGSIAGHEVAISKSSASRVEADKAGIERSGVFVLRGREVELRQSSVFLLIAPSVRGDVKVLVDWRGLVVLLAGFVVVTSVLRRMRRDRPRPLRHRGLFTRFRTTKLEPS